MRSHALAALALGASAALPGPAPPRARDYDAASRDRACATCHAEIGAEWQGSLHRQAWDDPLFLASYALEPRAFCRGCHAPEAAEGTSTARHEGVGCVTCHLAPHATPRDARLATDQACAGCHEFAFPTPQRALMQSTAREHLASPRANDPCQACHMRRSEGGAGHAKHDFRVTDATLRASVRVAARRDGPRQATLTLAAVAGHAVPTGDLFRRLELRASSTDGALHAAPVVLARRFAFEGGARVEVGDDRLPATGDPREVALVFDQDLGGRAVRWELVYQRTDPALAAGFGLDPSENEILLASGELTVETHR